MVPTTSLQRSWERFSVIAVQTPDTQEQLYSMQHYEYSLNIRSIYEYGHLWACPHLSYIDRIPVTSASVVQGYFRVLTVKLLSSNKMGCTTWHHLWITNNQKSEITAKRLRGVSPVWQLCKGRNIPPAGGSAGTRAWLNTKAAKCKRPVAIWDCL